MGDRSERLVVRTRAERPELEKACAAIEHESWKELGYLNFSRAFHTHYFSLLDRFAEHQLCLVGAEGYPVAVGNCVPIRLPADGTLPPEGWEWIVQTAATGDDEPDALGALAVSVPAVHRARGLAREMIRAMGAHARALGYRRVVVAVRPTAKAHHPGVPIEEYVGWTDGRGRIYDPWLRSHVAAGGRVIGPCVRSMVVDEPVGFWEIWSRFRFERSGEYLLPGCLAPIRIDLEAGRGWYADPNVWVVHEVGA